MKKTAILVSLLLFATTLLADGRNDLWSSARFIALGTNTSFRVICQVHYENLLDAGNFDETALVRNDKIVNIGIEKFLLELCNDMTDEERIVHFSTGAIQDCAQLDFEPWLVNYLDRINAKFGETAVAVRIDEIKMLPADDFAAALAVGE